MGRAKQERKQLQVREIELLKLVNENDQVPPSTGGWQVVGDHIAAQREVGANGYCR